MSGTRMLYAEKCQKAPSTLSEIKFIWMYVILCDFATTFLKILSGQSTTIFFTSNPGTKTAQGLQVQLHNQRALLGEFGYIESTISWKWRVSSNRKKLLFNYTKLCNLKRAVIQPVRLQRCRGYKNTEHITHNTANGCWTSFPSCSSLNLRYFFRGQLVLQSHEIHDSHPTHLLESCFGRYSGFVLYLMEMDENNYKELCAVSRIYRPLINDI